MIVHSEGPIFKSLSFEWSYILIGNISITNEGKKCVKGSRKRDPSKRGNYPNKQKAKMAKTMIVSLIPLNCLYLHKSSIQNFLFPSMK